MTRARLGVSVPERVWPQRCSVKDLLSKSDLAERREVPCTSFGTLDAEGLATPAGVDAWLGMHSGDVLLHRIC